MSNKVKALILSEKEKYAIKKLALDHYGANAQFMIAIEELSELIHALSRKARFPDMSSQEVAEELVDVLIATSYLPAIFDIDQQKLIELESFKLLRLRERILESSNMEDKD